MDKRTTAITKNYTELYVLLRTKVFNINRLFYFLAFCLHQIIQTATDRGTSQLINKKTTHLRERSGKLCSLLSYKKTIT